MSSFRVRPLFEHTVDLSPDHARSHLLESFAGDNARFEVRVFPGFIGLHIGEKDRRYWSPRLFLVLDATREGRTHIHGTYGPEIEVWSVFLYGYLLSGLIGMFAGILGCAQLFIGARPWGLWVTAATVVIAALLYLAAQLGQKLGAWQTFQLHQAYENAVGRPTEIR